MHASAFARLQINAFFAAIVACQCSLAFFLFAQHFIKNKNSFNFLTVKMCAHQFYYRHVISQRRFSTLSTKRTIYRSYDFVWLCISLHYIFVVSLTANHPPPPSLSFLPSCSSHVQTRSHQRRACVRARTGCLYLEEHPKVFPAENQQARK